MDLHVELLESKKNDFIRQIRSHSFLVRCREGRATLDELKRFLVQQGLYSSYFTRYLCALMSNLPSNADVLALAENLFEELGFDDSGAMPHHVIYRSMLEQFGLKLDGAAIEPGTHGLINAMLSHCRNPNPAFGLGAICLGAEALVPMVYADILEGFAARGVPSARTEFFRIHVECDDGHAETIRNIMVALGNHDAAQIDIMVIAGQALVDARMRFFDAIERPVYAARTVAR